ncbi:unnamed protein product [Ceutorhynchus assimilis]|uniref:Outer dense fiber protein 3 n=1 Tax=Ceutorhynchus assimilis TaxID=467358 RepID=A0A9P0DLL0_9CUCU|nr:unnamed protein product [Ceutorhynchus assimilis]
MGGMTQRPWTPTKRRGPIAAEYNSPGPACVALQSSIGKKPLEAKTGSAPAFSFGAKNNAKLESIGPGPGQYNVTGLSAKGKDTPPALSLHSRPKDPKSDNFPAPGDYNPDKAEKVIHDASPKYTFGLKTNVGKPLDTPAPNVYNIPSVVGDKKGAPAYTISGRNKEPLDERVKNPGPGQYNNVDPEHYKQHSPAYTMSGRTNVPKDETIPGPGVYSPEKVVLEYPPAHSFGIRHSIYADHY